MGGRRRPHGPEAGPHRVHGVVTLEDAEDHHRVLLVKGVTVCELLRDWTGYDYVD